MAALTLVANPGSASRKYALFAGDLLRASAHFEFVPGGTIVCTLQRHNEQTEVSANITELPAAAGRVVQLLHEHGALQPHEKIGTIGLRIVAPGSYFLDDHVVDDGMTARLEEMLPRAPLHIAATLQELHALRQAFADAHIVGVSDSKFHITKPDYAWNYGIALQHADQFDIKRFGYHGLSVASVARQLEAADRHAARMVVCHLGSGASVTAVRDGKSIDTTMGYSPLEGVVMATRSGSIDPTATRVLKAALNMNDQQLDEYLNTQGGLLGLGGSSDIRELLQREQSGDHMAALALQTYAYTVQKAIGQMAAALGGVDALVFTGTVGERSTPMRERIVAPLHYLDYELDRKANSECQAPLEITSIGMPAHSKPVLVVPAQEAQEIARCAQRL